ncbi:MAG: SAM-dependent methyltransferase, partial [Planctomycetota bacterium]
MSKFENYTSTSNNYDLTRRPVGMELILGTLVCGSRPLAEQVVLDAGCGTGNYVAALAGKVKMLEGVELNPGMLGAAQAKMSGRADVRLQEGSIVELPIESGSCDGVLVNFVLHHLDDGSDANFSATRRAIAECARVLAPGGTLIVQTSSAAQYRQGYWYSALIPKAIERALDRYIPIEDLITSMSDAGLNPGGRLVPLDEVLQGDTYLDPRGPLRSEWRDGDSSWAMVDEAELASAIGEIERMLGDDSMDAFLAEREKRRREHGQATFVLGKKAP